jgi:diaminopimelate epimerase
MKFIKMHGTGNDYVYMDLFRDRADGNSAELAKKVSHRHYGIGSDGLILIKPRSDGDGEMEMFNADGSKSEMCGNGIRCVAKYVHDHYARGKDELKLMTGNGWLTARIVKRDAKGAAELIRIDMGAPIWQGLKIPTTFDLPEVLEQKIEVAGKTFTFSSVSMGNPHCVIYVDDVKNFPVETIGPLIETHRFFPRKVNVEFVQIVKQDEVIQRTWERGAGETWACGTGASAVAAVGVRLGRTGSRLTNHLTGGDLLLEYDGKGSVLMTGNAVEVFSGEWPG